MEQSTIHNIFKVVLIQFMKYNLYSEMTFGPWHSDGMIHPEMVLTNTDSTDFDHFNLTDNDINNGNWIT